MDSQAKVDPIIYVAATKATLQSGQPANDFNGGLEFPCVFCKTMLHVNPESWASIIGLAKIKNTRPVVICYECTQRDDLDMDKIDEIAQSSVVEPENN